MNISMNLFKKLGSNLNEFENFRSDPFVLFEKSNFLNSQDYKNLVDEIYSFKNFENIFQEIRKFSDSNNAKLIFVYLDGYSKDILLKKAIKKTIKKMNINFIDVAEEMDKKKH